MASNLEPLLEKALTALERDIKCLLQESVQGLSSTRASSLTAYIKMLREILADEKESEEALRARVEEILRNTGKGNSGSAGPTA